MATITTPRLGLTNWTEDSDEWSREKLAANLTAIDTKVAIDLQGATIANRPAAGVRGRLFTSLDDGAVFRDTGTAWTYLGGMRPFHLIKAFIGGSYPTFGTGWQQTVVDADGYANDDAPVPSWLAVGADAKGSFAINSPGWWRVVARATFTLEQVAAPSACAIDLTAPVWPPKSYTESGQATAFFPASTPLLVPSPYEDGSDGGGAAPSVSLYFAQMVRVDASPVRVRARYQSTATSQYNGPVISHMQVSVVRA